jgi:putative toxin-antitoxin system antitoxin component (TIGR02293 family)
MPLIRHVKKKVNCIEYEQLAQNIQKRQTIQKVQRRQKRQKKTNATKRAFASCHWDAEKPQTFCDGVERVAKPLEGPYLMGVPFVAIIDDSMVNELRAVIQELGGEQILGRAFSSDRDMREAIREGFPPAVVEELMRASGLTLRELASALDLSPRSLQRRRRSGRLARYESDRLYRLARIVAIANEYLGDHERVLRWLKRPNRALGGVAPVAAIDTEPGARQVENILGRIAYGGIS